MNIVEDKFPVLRFGYTNHRDEYTERLVVAPLLYYGSSDFYPEDQWMLRAFDVHKGAWRDFAVERMKWELPQ